MLLDENNFDKDLATKLRTARCLLLNSDYQPINYLPLSTLSWNDAIVAVMQNKVDIISLYDDVVVHSASHQYFVPSIVVNKVYRKPRTRIEFSKSNVFLRDDFRCQFCGNHGSRSTLTFDHWIPRSKGGKTTWDNIVTACYNCNNKKGTQNKKRWKPRATPKRPTYMELINKAKHHPIIIPDVRWVPYLQWQGVIKVHNWKENYIYEEQD